MKNKEYHTTLQELTQAQLQFDEARTDEEIDEANAKINYVQAKLCRIFKEEVAKQ